MIRSCIARSIPVVFVNLRISDTTFRRARMFKSLSRLVLRDVSQFCVQSEQDAKRIIDMGATPSKVVVTGSLKFDVPLPLQLKQNAATLRKRWGEHRPVIVLASSHEGEESRFMAQFEHLKRRFPELICAIVPRHPERFDAVYELLCKFEFKVSRYSNMAVEDVQAVDVLLVDTMGELMLFYAASDVAVVGGSFVSVGGHNILEPIATEVSTVFGPDMANFREIARRVTATGAGIQVLGFDALPTVISGLLKEPETRQRLVANGTRMLRFNRGALEKTIGLLLPVVEQVSRR